MTHKKFVFIRYILHLYCLIIKQLGMNKDKGIERLKKQISKLREENRQLKSDARIAKRTAAKADKKKTP